MWEPWRHKFHIPTPLSHKQKRTNGTHNGELDISVCGGGGEGGEYKGEHFVEFVHPFFLKNLFPSKNRCSIYTFLNNNITTPSQRTPLLPLYNIPPFFIHFYRNTPLGLLSNLWKTAHVRRPQSKWGNIWRISSRFSNPKQGENDKFFHQILLRPIIDRLEQPLLSFRSNFCFFFKLPLI
jgi:hypothetical protein